MQTIVQSGGFRSSSLGRITEVLTKSKNWPAFDGFGPKARAYFRVITPRTGRMSLPIRGNRARSELLVVDATGTNAYFIMWDTD